MSFILFCEELNRKIVALQHRFETGKPITPLKAIGKLSVYGVKRAVAMNLVKPYKKGCLNIAVRFNGGIGDVCMQFQWAKTFVEELKAHDCKFAVICLTDKKDFLQKISQGLDIFDDIVGLEEWGRSVKVDLLLNLNHLVTPIVDNKQALQKYAPFLVEPIEKCFTSQKFFLGNGRYPVSHELVSDHFLITHRARLKGYDMRDLLGSSGLCKFDRNTLCWFPVDKEQVQKTLEHFKLSGRKFILICSSIGSIQMPEGISKEQAEFYRKHATKLIPPDLAAAFIKLIKQELPDYLLVQIGGVDSVEFSGCDLNLIGLTSYDESIDLLYAADCFIGNDSGNTHLRHAMGKRSVVLWGPTPADYIGYDSDFHIQGVCSACARVPCDGCMWVSHYWSVICPAGFEQPECMNSIKPEQILAAVRTMLENTDETKQI